jgi:hypothetical protein
MLSKRCIQELESNCFHVDTKGKHTILKEAVAVQKCTDLIKM